MRGLITLAVIGLLLIGFVGAIGITSRAIDNSTGNGNQEKNQEGAVISVKSGLNSSQIKAIIKERNRIRAEAQQSECPESCTCTGSVMKCQLANGREITVTAGKSGNVIIQIKGENMSTNVTLYKSEEKIYGIFKNNETKVVKMFPDQIKEKLKEKTAKVLEDEEITLEEDGTYQYKARKKSKLFLFIPIRIRVRAQINAETGEIIKTSKPSWWEFLTKDEQESILGASCGTVSPGQNDACCKTRGYDVWDIQKSECVFSN